MKRTLKALAVTVLASLVLLAPSFLPAASVSAAYLGPEMLGDVEEHTAYFGPIVPAQPCKDVLPNTGAHR